MKTTLSRIKKNPPFVPMHMLKEEWYTKKKKGKKEDEKEAGERVGRV